MDRLILVEQVLVEISEAVTKSADGCWADQESGVNANLLN